MIISWSLSWFGDSVLVSQSFSLMHPCFRNLLIRCLNRACISSDSKWIRGWSLWKNTRCFSNRVDTDTMNSSWTQSECFFCSFDVILLYAALCGWFFESTLANSFHISTITGICYMILCRSLSSVTHLVGIYCKNTYCSTCSVCCIDCKSSFLGAAPLEKACRSNASSWVWLP